MAQQFKIGDRVERKIAPGLVRIITRVDEGCFSLTDEYGSPKGGAFSDDLVLA